MNTLLDRLREYEIILNPSSPLQVVDVNRLRSLASRGLPDNPPWIREGVWQLLLGCLPPEKALWQEELRRRRERYYTLARTFLDEVEKVPQPTLPLAPRDKLLDTIAKDVNRTQPRLAFFRQPIPPNAFCPLTPEPIPSPDGALPVDRIASARALNSRLEILQNTWKTKPTIPEDFPESPTNANPPPHFNIPPPSPTTPGIPVLSITSPTSSTFPASSTSPIHADALLRILYLFCILHPHQLYTQGLNELVAPIYHTFCMSGAVGEEGSHSEADTFWAFGELIGDIGDVIGDPGDWKSFNEGIPSAAATPRGVMGAMQQLSERLRWADTELWLELKRKSLDPALPYYSYRWIALLLAQDFPLPDLLSLWDSLFSRPPFTPTSPVNPRIDFLIDVCCSMLLRLRGRLMLCGRRQQSRGGIWSDDDPFDHQSSGVMGEGFAEGIAILQRYPVEVVGLRSIMDGAFDLISRRKREHDEALAAANANKKSRLVNLLTWASNTPEYGETHDDLGVSPSPSPSYSSDSDTSEENYDQADAHQSDATFRAPRPQLSLKSYAASFIASDTAASLSKVGTNFKAKAVDVWSKSSIASPIVEQSPASPSPATSTSAWSPWNAGRLWGSKTASSLRSESPMEVSPVGSTGSGRSEGHSRWASESVSRRRDTSPYSPPPLPSHFSSPRDSFRPLPRFDNNYPSGTESDFVASPTSATSRIGIGLGSLHTRLSSISQALVSPSASSRELSPSSRGATPPPIIKTTGPRPLLLGSSARPGKSISRASSASPSGDKSPVPTSRALIEDPHSRSRNSSMSSTASDGFGSRVVPLRGAASVQRRSRFQPSPARSQLSSSPPPLPPLPKNVVFGPTGGRESPSALGLTRSTTPVRNPIRAMTRPDFVGVADTPDSPAVRPAASLAPSIESSLLPNDPGHIPSKSGTKSPQRYRLQDPGPIFTHAPTASLDSESSQSSPSFPKDDTITLPGSSSPSGSRIRTKRSYNHKPANLLFPPSQDIPTVVPEGNPSPSALSPFETRGDELQPLTPRPPTIEEARTPTLISHDQRNGSQTSLRRARSPNLRASPRRTRKESLKVDIKSERPVVMSEEEGVKADDEDDYGDLLSAYTDEEGSVH